MKVYNAYTVYSNMIVNLNYLNEYLKQLKSVQPFRRNSVIQNIKNAMLL